MEYVILYGAASAASAVLAWGARGYFEKHRARKKSRAKNRARMYELRQRDAHTRVELLPGEWEAGRRRAGLDAPERKPPIRKVTGVFSDEEARRLLHSR